MRDFITCLEFLTRVRFSKRTDWRDEDFSRSVPYFPLVGLVIGFLLAAVNYSLFYIETPLFLRVTLLLLLKIAAYLELSGETLTWVLLTMSVATRTFMVVFIVNFPYARKEGIGHMFTKYAKPFYTYIAFAVCAGIIAACGLQYLAVAGICFTVTLIIAQYLKTQLGGLTGDTYGALTECGNVIYLLTAVFLLR